VPEDPVASLSQRSYNSNFSYNSMISQESSSSNTNSYYSSSGTSQSSMVSGGSGGTDEKPLKR
jgi:hypothetical protein